MESIVNGGILYLEEFHDYWNLSRVSSYPKPIKDRIQYFFGIEKKHLTKKNIQDKEKFVQTILAHSTKSELEEYLESETIELLNCAQ
jgi:uncharacterized Ntn-hydrolase superfamily protein